VRPTRAVITVLPTGPSGGGGVYLWESREAAEAFYAAGFRAIIRERFGVEPQIT